ncbi:Ku DNA-binding complex, Ku70 subunit [Coprinopsis marcescibilis]|uniref:ATP-dependent DNA helicase II subunit 1 n=1 Tax=Coprinopsis marcescibilis TaxID=230819 RepID=A0A5C3KVX2_COPMA|nr:Ku DNA-binding complex, Ku70 subunit [Coprinopsis marcescibilis]
MAPYDDDWTKIDDEDDEELQDYSIFEGQRDVILFCIDCSESMQALYEDPNDEDAQTSNLAVALEAAKQIQKKKIIAGPNDSVGIMLFNTTRRPDAKGAGGYASEIKLGTFLYQPISLLSASKIKELMLLLDAAKEDPEELVREFPPKKDRKVPIGDVFTSCNWILRDGAPKTATKRIFLITDDDNPHQGPGSEQLRNSARTTLIDLTQSGVTVEPFFISTEDKPFDVSKFYSSVLLPNNILDEDELEQDSSVLSESISISRIEDLLAQMRFHESPKRALFSVPLHLAEGFTIGVKGYALITEQKKGSYKYFVDTGGRMALANVKTVYVDEDRDAEVDKSKFFFGSAPGSTAASAEKEDDDQDENIGARTVKADHRPFYTAEETRAFRTMGLVPGFRLLGFKDAGDLAFEDNVKHAYFIYPNEMSYSGSKRTFSALLKSMINKNKIALALALMRKNASPVFCYLLPQEEIIDDNGCQIDPPGFHIIPLPFADDIRAAPIQEAFRAPPDLVKSATEWVDKLKIKTGTYPPDSYRNPALAYHNEQLEASAFRDEYNPEDFEDETEPPISGIHKKAGKLMKAWKDTLANDESANIVSVPTTGSKRKADVSVNEAEIRSYYDNGSLEKLRVDQLKEFLKSKGVAVSGKKADLVERVADWFTTN